MILEIRIRRWYSSMKDWELRGKFNNVSKEIGVPLVAFSVKDHRPHDEFEIWEMLRRFGWIVLAYTMPADAQHVTVLRVMIKEDFSRTLAERLDIDIERVLRKLDSLPARVGSKYANVLKIPNYLQYH
nr:glutamate decarboxylase [Ipomoea trifida]